MQDDIGQIWNRLARWHLAMTFVIASLSFFLEPSWFGIVASVLHGQLIVLSIWLAFATAPISTRLELFFAAGVPVAVLSFAAPLWPTTFLPLFLISLWLTISVAIAYGLPLLIARHKGWQLTNDAPNTVQPWRFSTRTILALTLLVALVLTLRRVVASMGIPYENGTIGFPDNSYSLLALPVVFCATQLGLSVSVLSAVWSCLGNLTQLGATFVVIAIVCAFPVHLHGGTAHLGWPNGCKRDVWVSGD